MGWWVGALTSQPLGVGEVEEAGPGKALPLVAFFVLLAVSLTLISEEMVFRSRHADMLLSDFVPSSISVAFRGPAESSGARYECVLSQQGACPCLSVQSL